MNRVVVDISTSLDGFVTGPNPGVRSGLGDGGAGLHAWALGDARTEADIDILDRTLRETGAVLMGRRTFDVVDGPEGWDESVGYGADRGGTAEPEQPPVIVVTSSPPATVRLAALFTFVTDGIDSALRRAREAAGDRDVVIMGGADLARQYLAAGHVDELRLHLAPLLLGDGTPLFERSPALAATGPIALEQSGAVVTAAATHLTYRVLGASAPGPR